MGWDTIHSYAEEAELWTTLAINCWIILAAISFVFRGTAGPERLADSAIDGIAILGAAGFGVGILNIGEAILIWIGIVSPYPDHGPLFETLVSLAMIIVSFFPLWAWSRHAERKERDRRERMKVLSPGRPPA